MLSAQAVARRAQRGLVLVLALIVVGALSLAAVGLMRGVLGSNRVAGNLATQQAAVNAADVGIERAVALLEQASWELTGDDYVTRLQNSFHAGVGGNSFHYSATRADPAGQDWEAFWTTLVAANLVNTLPRDANGNQVQFVIHRLCQLAGDPSGAQCEMRRRQQPTCGKRNPPLSCLASQVYYRITVRVDGPRNAKSFVQAVVAI